mgnify:CR=1 FL=1
MFGLQAIGRFAQMLLGYPDDNLMAVLYGHGCGRHRRLESRFLADIFA